MHAHTYGYRLYTCVYTYKSIIYRYYQFIYIIEKLYTYIYIYIIEKNIDIF